MIEKKTSKYQDKALEMTPVDDVWGIDRKYAAFLTIRGIKTAKDFKYTNPKMILKRWVSAKHN